MWEDPRLRFARQMLFARGVAKGAPGRNRALPRSVDFRIGVEPGFNGQGPGALLMGGSRHLAYRLGMPSSLFQTGEDF
jgi:hypothetical protein